MLRTVIVDDERLARRELRALLEVVPEVAVVGEAETVQTAAEVVRATDADAVFLDVQLREEVGFDLLPLLPTDTQVVFVTAFEQYALRAFEHAAIDYLLKPVAPQRLVAAISRLATAPAPERLPDSLLYDDFLFLRVNGRMRFIKVRGIAAISASGNESTLWLAGGAQLTVRKGIGDWQHRLPKPWFTRIHRGAIVNLDYVDRLEDWSHASHLVYLRGFSEPLPMSRRFASEMRARFG